MQNSGVFISIRRDMELTECANIGSLCAVTVSIGFMPVSRSWATLFYQAASPCHPTSAREKRCWILVTSRGCIHSSSNRFPQ